jgi:hypothetical protein
MTGSLAEAGDQVRRGAELHRIRPDRIVSDWKVYTMTAARFAVDRVTDATIAVRHVEDGHIYTFYIVNDPATLSRVSFMNHRSSPSAKHPADYYLGEAIQFAEAEVRERKLGCP